MHCHTERRVEPRHPFRCEATLTGAREIGSSPQPGEPIPATVNDVSSGGLGALVLGSPSLPSLLRCELKFPRVPAAIPVLAVLRWQRPEDNALRVGLQFLASSAKDDSPIWVSSQGELITSNVFSHTGCLRKGANMTEYLWRIILRWCRYMSALLLLGFSLARDVAEAQGIFAYVANQSSNNVSVIDTTSTPPTVVATIGGFNCPRGVAVTPDASRVFVTNICGTTVSIISTATNSILATLGVGAQPWGVAVSPDGSRVYVANNSSGTVTVIDNTTTPPTVLTTIGGVGFVNYVAVHPDGTRAYVTSSTGNTVWELNTASNTITTSVGTGSNPFGVAVTPDGNRLYVVSNSSGVFVYDATISPPSFITNIGIGGNGIEVAVTPDGTRAYVAQQNFGVRVVDNSTAPPSLLTTVPVSGFPFGVAITPDSVAAYVTNAQSSVFKISTSSNTVVTTVGVGSTPLGVAITPKLADVSISKLDSPDPVVTGANLTYSITATNDGPQDAQSVVVTDELDASTTFVSCISTGGGVCFGSGNSRSVTFASLGAGSSEVITVITKVNDVVVDGALIPNDVAVASDTSDPDASNNADATLTTASNPPPSITCPADISAPATSTSGALVNYPSASATDNTPGTTVVFDPPSGSTLPIGTTGVTATATDSGGRTASCSFNVIVFSVDLAISLSASPEPVEKGENLAYTINVQNLSPDTATALLMDDAIPSESSFVSVRPGSWSCSTPPVGSTGTVSCNLDSLAGNTSTTVELVIKVNAGFKKSTISNAAGVTSGVYDPDAANNSATRVTAVKKSGKDKKK